MKSRLAGSRADPYQFIRPSFVPSEIVGLLPCMKRDVAKHALESQTGVPPTDFHPRYVIRESRKAARGFMHHGFQDNLGDRRWTQTRDCVGDYRRRTCVLRSHLPQ
jgi:hypothetical protein